MKFDFDVWLEQNPHIYKAFEREALSVAKRREHYSAKTIVEFLRHHTMITQKEGEWKIDNYATSGLARHFAKCHPTHASLFKFRGLK